MQANTQVEYPEVLREFYAVFLKLFLQRFGLAGSKAF